MMLFCLTLNIPRSFPVSFRIRCCSLFSYKQSYYLLKLPRLFFPIISAALYQIRPSYRLIPNFLIQPEMLLCWIKPDFPTIIFRLDFDLIFFQLR